MGVGGNGRCSGRFIGGRKGERGRGLRYFVYLLRGTMGLNYDGSDTDKIRYNYHLSK